MSETKTSKVGVLASKSATQIKLMTENLEENILEEGDSAVYEIGYHLVPTIGDENMLAESSKIKEMILGSGGKFVSEGVPSMK